MAKSGIDLEIDILFKLPLSEFISARNALAKRLKQSGRGPESEQVKTLAKPPVSAWAVNQLYWNQRDTFDRLLNASEQYRTAQTALLAGKSADVRAPQDVRRTVLSELSRQAALILQEAGHNPGSDILRRIGMSLEAISAQPASLESSPAGRLTADVSPVGFDALASLIPPGSRLASPVVRQEPVKAPTKIVDWREKRAAQVAAAKAALEIASHAVAESQAAVRKAEADLSDAERRKQEAEDRLTLAKTAVTAAERRAAEAEQTLAKL